MSNWYTFQHRAPFTPWIHITKYSLNWSEARSNFTKFLLYRGVLLFLPRYNMVNCSIFQVTVEFLCFPMNLQWGWVQCIITMIKDLIVWHQVAWELFYINTLVYNNFSSLLKYFNMFEYKIFPSVLKYFITGQLVHDRDDTTYFFSLIILSWSSYHPSLIPLKRKWKEIKAGNHPHLKCPISLQKQRPQGRRHQVKQFSMCWSWNAVPTGNCTNIDPRIQGEMGLAPDTL